MPSRLFLHLYRPRVPNRERDRTQKTKDRRSDLHNRGNAAMMAQFPPSEYSVDNGSPECPSVSQQRLAQAADSGIGVGHCLAALFCGHNAGAMHAARYTILTLRPSRQTPTQPARQLLPENGHLSNTTYTSDYFGFAFDLPIPAQGHLIMLPLMPERQHALLALSSRTRAMPEPSPSRRSSHGPGWRRRPPQQQQQEFNNWASSGSQPGRKLRYPIPDYMLHTTGRFYSSVRHKGENYAALYSDADQELQSQDFGGFQRSGVPAKSPNMPYGAAHFYCTQDDGKLTTADGKPVKPDGDVYMGPTVPTSLADAAVKDKPALASIPLGGVSGGVYRNPDLSFQYAIPKGWEVLPAEANDDPPRDATRVART